MAEGASPSSETVIKTLEWTRRQGFKPVALRKQSKAAIDEKYVDLNYAPPPNDLWLSRDLGIGVVTGPKHKGPVDIDLDCPEAVFFARRFLPPTPAVFGRKSKISSHYLYRVEVDSFPKKALIDPLAKTNSTIIEMRGDGGHQTVFPGSIHEGTGELIEWSEAISPDVPRCDAVALEKAVKKVAIATLVVRHMWLEGQRNEIVKHLSGLFFYLDWTEEEVKDLIASIMEFSGDTDRTRLRTVGITYRKAEKGGKVTGSNTLRALLGDARLVDRILEWSGSQSASILQDYNERFAVVSIEGKFRVAETTALEKGGAPTLFAKEDFLNMMATDTIAIDNKPVPKAKLWLSNPRRRAYKAMDFIPGQEDTSPVLNLWTGWGIEPSDKHSCRGWLDLLYYVVCGGDDAAYQWMLHWFANILREPTAKALTAPVIIGRQGVGKSLLMAYFGKILGPGYMVVTHEEHIYGRFNKHLTTTLLLHSEEALYGGDRKHRGIIKSLITDEYRMFEPKGVDAKRVRNYLRLVLTSNEAWAAPTEAGDRRFTVIDMGSRKSEDKLLRQVLTEMEGGGPASLFYYLLNMEYDPLIPRTNLKNDALATLKKINFDPVAAWWYECLTAGQLLPDYLCWACRPERAEWPQVVSSSALHLSMVHKMQLRGYRYSADPTSWSLQLNKMVNRRLERIQKYYTNPQSEAAPREVRLLPSKHYTIINMPTLEECRAAFNEYVGQTMTWAKEEENDDRPPHVKF